VRSKGVAVNLIQNKRVATRDLVKVLLVTLLLLSPPVMAAENGAQAQTDNPDEASGELEVSEERGASAASESEESELTPGSDAELAVADESDYLDQPEDAGSSRFIPSEEISQDLGVSFPVDI